MIVRTAVLAAVLTLLPLAANAQIEREPRPLPPASAFGLYGGAPSAAGLHAVGPVDGPIGFRMGLTGWPRVGLLWTPGFEVRFRQEPGTLSTSSAYLFSNYFIGRQLTAETEEKNAMEAGLGYRFFLNDRRGKRWVLALESGGYWRSKHALPLRPTIRLMFVRTTR